MNENRTPSASTEPAVYEIDRERLLFGHWDEKDRRRTGEGDIRASYSADVIALHGRVRKPFMFRNRLWVCVGTFRGLTPTAKAYRLELLNEFNGAATTYQAKTRDSAQARRDPNGFYHGMAVRRGKQEYVLAGPPAVFVPGAVIQQPSLFPTD